MATKELISTNWASVLPDDRHLKLPLTKEEVLAAASRWGGQRRPAWLSQWSAIETIADDTWRTSADEPELQRRLWVFLVYSIGNFKRQGNTGIFPFPAPWTIAPRQGRAIRKPVLSIPLLNPAIVILRKGTTEHLSHLRGLASAPTGSTLLSALWPGHHAIIDRRDFQAAVALLAHGGSPVVARNEVRSLRAPDWTEYKWFRQLIRLEAKRLSVSAVEIERSLFVAYGLLPLAFVAGDDWETWGERLKARWPQTKPGG